MFCVPNQHLILSVTVICKALLFVSGHGQCSSVLHVDNESNRYYKSFLHLDIIGPLQCLALCKKYKLCKKIYHDREQLTCDLMMTCAQKGKMTSLVDVQSVQIGNSSCSHVSCTETAVCVDIANRHHVCVSQDVCPGADWVHYKHKCYLFPGIERTAHENVEFCKMMNSAPIRVDDHEVNAFLKLEMAQRGFGQLLLALNDRSVVNKWVWSPGDEVQNPLWMRGQPNGRDNKNCVILVSGDPAGWNNISCSKNFTIACNVWYKISP